MKKLLNTLFVTTNEAYLHKKRETVVIDIEHKQIAQIPFLSLCNIYCIGRVSLSPQLMEHCVNNNIGISLFNEYGRFQARIVGRKNGNVLLRRQQYRIADDENIHIDIVRNSIGAKIINSRNVLLRNLRNRPNCEGSEKLKLACNKMKKILERLQRVESVDSIRGHEGESSNIYFDAFDYLISQQKEDFKFNERNRRPPKDPVNALLSFAYSIVQQDCASALEGVGLDSYVGFMHRDRPGRQSLALDQIEEVRAFIADRLCLSLINLRQITLSDFSFKENGAVFLNDTGRKTFLKQYQSRKQDEIIHPIIKEKVKIGLLFHIQAMLLARHIRGDLDYYPAFIWR